MGNYNRVMRILLAVDDSDCSNAAVEMLTREMRTENSEVHVFHAIESIKLIPPPYNFGAGTVFPQGFVTMIQEWRSQGEALVARTAKLLQSAGFDTHTAVREGDAKTAILEYAEECH